MFFIITFINVCYFYNTQVFIKGRPMKKWKLKSCPRCSGDLNIINDNVVLYENCLQCGYTHYLSDIKIQTRQYQPSTVETKLEASGYLHNYSAQPFNVNRLG